MPYAEVNHIRLYYEVQGDADAPPLLLNSGMGGDHRAWGNIAPRLAQGYRIVTWDPRDAGQSGRASSDYTVVDMAEDAAGLLRHLGVASAYVAGFSMGGAIAQEMAIRYPRLVQRLVLIATYDADDPRGTFMFNQFAKMRRTLPRKDYARLILPWLYTHQEFEDPELVESRIKYIVEDPFFQERDAYERQVQATVSFRSRERLHLLECPTLLIFGDQDMFTPLRFARSLEAGIKGSQLVLLSGTGHGLLWTRGDQVAALLDTFLGQGKEG